MDTGWSTHKGKKFLFCNYSNRNELSNLQAEAKRIEDIVVREPENSVLSVADVTGTLATPAVIDLFKGISSRTKKYVRKQAVVGVGFTGPRKVLLDLVIKVTGVPMVIFNTIDEAKDWLVTT